MSLKNTARKTSRGGVGKGLWIRVKIPDGCVVDHVF